ncbi:MAG: alkaline phosphatase family protein, partial [Segetibacter sp.]|nr:alkaline phosphatase family protein [Segetibacter sp.]
RFNSIFSIVFMCVLANTLSAQKSKTASNDTFGTRTLIVFFDGLRPDYITPENMPNLYAFKKSGSYANQHHSVFPTVTRVNSSSYSTGSYPAKTGLMGNTVYFPEVNKTKGLNTGNASELMKINEATHGKLLTAISLGEILKAAGKRMMVFSSGSSGQAFLQNHTVSGGAVINTSMILPASLENTIIKEIGPIPSNAKPNTAQHKWITDALIKYGFAPGGPLVSAIWFSDPDGTAHSDGIGSATAMRAIKSVDEQFGRIISTLKNQNLLNHFNIIISTDHGFVTHKGNHGLTEYLIKEGLKKDTASQDVVVAEGAIYVKDHNADIINKIVAKLQSQEWIGAIFTKASKPGSLKGSIEGTLSFGSIHWNHPVRAADILADENWDDNKNSAGYAGTSYARGVAGHGGFSPYEVHIPLIVSGPAFKTSFESNLPTSNVDIAPTVLYLNNITIPPSMDGRIMSEFLLSSKSKSKAIKPELTEAEVRHAWGSYKLQLERSILGKHSYVNYAKVVRVMNTGNSK